MSTRPRRAAAGGVVKKVSIDDSSIEGNYHDDEGKIAKKKVVKKKSVKNVEVVSDEDEQDQKPKKKVSKKKEISIPLKENEDESNNIMSTTGQDVQVEKCFSYIESNFDIKREAEKLNNLYQADSAGTLKKIVECMNRVFVVYKTTPQISLYLELIQSFISMQSIPFQVEMLSKFASVHLRAKDKAIRLRSTQLIRLWLRAQKEIPEEIFSKLCDGLMERSFDKDRFVRQEAIFGLEFFQDPNCEEDTVISRLCTILRDDHIAGVRKAVLRVLCPSPLSLNAIVTRVLDESVDVRTGLFKELSDRMRMEWFHSDHLVELFDQGLKDISDSVKEASKKVLLKWFKEQKNSDTLSFLESFSPNHENEEAILRILKVLNDVIPPVTNISPSASLSNSASIFLRYLAEMKSDDIDVTSSSLMEALVQILQVLKHSEEGTRNYDSCTFIAKQLVKACSFLDIAHDPIGRMTIERVICESLLLENFPAFLVDPMVETLRNCFEHQTNKDSLFVLQVWNNALSLLSDLSPLDQVRADIRKAEQLFEEYTKAKNYQSLHKLLLEIEELKAKEVAILNEKSDDSPSVSPFSRIVRAAALASAVLKYVPRTYQDSILSNLLDTVCIPAIQSSEPEAMVYGVETLGLLSLRDLELAKSHGLLLAKTFVENEREIMIVRLKSLQILFDLLIAYGQEVDPNEFDSLIQYLMSLLEIKQEPEIRFTAALGLSKILYLGRVAFPGLVQCLMIVLFHPSAESNGILKQTLSAFLAEYKHKRVILTAADPLLQAIISPTEDSMCEDLPLEKILERLNFLLCLNGEDKDLVSDFAIMLLTKIAENPDEITAMKTLAKGFVSISFTSDTIRAEKLPQLRYLLNLVMSCCITDKKMEKVATNLEKLNGSSDIQISEELKSEVEKRFKKGIKTVAIDSSKRSTTRRARGKDNNSDEEEDDSEDEE